ncbi:MAG: alkaline phosphatase family protein, partial [Anaerolineae bacterium]
MLLRIAQTMKKITASLTKLLYTALELLAALLGTYYSARYALLSRRLARPDVARDRKRGFVVIQIDGLSYDHIRAAVDMGYAPHLRRLLEHEEMHLYPWKPGIPGTTPATQAGIMYGHSDPVPAFRWYDKRSGQAKVSSQPGVAQAIQAELEERAPGILRGGSSYMNMFDGGASLALFTLGTFGRSRFFEGLRGLGFLTLFALNPFRSGAVLALAIWEYLTDLAQRAEATLRRTSPRPLSRAFPFLRVMSSVVLRDIQTFSVTLDLFRGVPAVYTTYFGYDELAHHYGPLSKPALRALRAIDSRVRRLDRFRRMSPSRQYDLYLLSDHGMTEDVPFSSEYGQTLGDLVQGLVGRSAAIRELYSSQQPELSSTLFVQQELEA